MSKRDSRTRTEKANDSDTSRVPATSQTHKILFINHPALRYSFALVMVVFAILLRYALSPLIGPDYRTVTIYPIVIVVAILAGWWPTILMTVLSIIANAYLFADVFDALILTSSITILFTAFLAGWLAERLHTALDKSQNDARALAQTEQQFRSLFDLAGAGNAQVDAKTHRYIRVNHKFCEITGYSPEELQQLRFTDITHPDDRQKDAELFEQAKSERKQHVSEKRYVRKDGSIRWVHVAASIVFDKDGNPSEAIGSVFDITERKHRETEIHRLNRTLRAISNSSQAMMHAAEEHSFLQQVCDIIVRDCGHTLVWIGYAENDPGKTIRPVAFSGFEAAYLETFTMTWAATESGRSPIAEAVRTGKPALCKNLQTDPCFGPWRDQALKRGYASAIAMPITAHQRTFGVLTIYSKEPDPFPPDEIKLLTELTIDLAFGITALRLRAEEEKAKAVQKYFRSLFESAPGLYLVLEPEDFKIAAVSDAYLRGTMTERFDIMGKGLFEVFPDQPGDPLADGVRNLRASLEHVKASKLADVMAVQRYPIRRPDGSWEERWWSPINSPVFGPEGQIAYIIHRVEDVTSYIRRMEKQGQERQARQELEKWQQHLEAEIVMRSQELQRLNNQLRESEEKFRMLSENARAVIGIVQGEHFIYVNPYMEELSGYTRDEILQIPIGQMVHPESRAMVIDRARRRQMGEPVETHYEFAMLTKSGEKRWIDFSVNAIHYHGRPAITGIGVDITERKQAEWELRKAQERTNDDLKAMTILHELGNLSLTEQNFNLVQSKIVDAAISMVQADFGNIQLLESPKSLKIVAYRGFPQWWVDYWNTLIDGKSACRTALQTGEQVIVEEIESSPIFMGTPELEIQLKAGVRAVVSTPLQTRSGKILGMISIHYKRPHIPDDRQLRLLEILSRQAADIIDRRQTEEKLLQSERRFRDLADSMPQIVWTARPEGPADYFNRKWYEITKADPNKIGAESWVPALHPDDVQRVKQLVAESISTGKIFNTELRLKIADTNEYRWYIARALPVRDENGKIVRWYGTATDIHDLKQARDALDSLKTDLENKNKELESIIGIVSHDLRAPLVNIHGFSNELRMDYKAVDTLLSESPVEKQVEKQLDTLLHRTIPQSIQYIEGSAQAMNNLVVTLVEVARAGLMPVTPETLDMNSLLRQILASIEIKVKEAAASYDIEDMPPCMADKTHAEQIFRNLLDNALKYLDPNRPGQVCIGGKLQAGSALYWVADNGIGISQEHQDKIFEPYYQLKEKAASAWDWPPSKNSSTATAAKSGSYLKKANTLPFTLRFPRAKPTIR